MKNRYLLLGILFLGLNCFAQEEVASSSSEPAMSGELRTTLPEKRKKYPRVKGEFKGKDVMVPPDPKGELPPTDGSRPKSK